jgi:EAL domain-containing protein (putative c-di-GMP-specific phosphodiesterase class I)
LIVVKSAADIRSMTTSSGPFTCGACKDGVESPFLFTMAFQPIVNLEDRRVFAYEALVRGPRGQGASSVLAQVTDQNRYAFDQHCRVKAITLASQLQLPQTGAMLSINFMPGAVYSPQACIQLTLKTASSCGFPLRQLIFEITEAEEVRDRNHLRNIVDEYRRHGFKVALDDFGSGFCGLNLLADFPADIIKLDMELTRNLDQRPAALAIVKQMVVLSRELGSTLIAEGIETVQEVDALRRCGIHLMQGYLFAKPALEALPSVSFPAEAKPLPLHGSSLPKAQQRVGMHPKQPSRSH